jgi:hypothetical protein
MYAVAYQLFFYFQCQTTFYKKEDGEFKKSPFGIVPTPCCELLFQNEIFKPIMESQNVPKACPFKQVSTHLPKLTPVQT